MKTELKIIGIVSQVEEIRTQLKWELSDSFIGFGKKDSNTEHYSKQAEGNMVPYNKKNTIVHFVSINGNPNKEDLILTTMVAEERLKKGDFLLTDNCKYLEKSKYNKGEKCIKNNLLSMGYFSEQLEACSLVSIWGKDKTKLKGMNKELSMQAIERNLICS